MPANLIMLFSFNDREAEAFKGIYLFALCFPVLDNIADLFTEFCHFASLPVRCQDGFAQFFSAALCIDRNVPQLPFNEIKKKVLELVFAHFVDNRFVQQGHFFVPTVFPVASRMVSRSVQNATAVQIAEIRQRRVI